ncbi:MAG: GH92 family glycosyl hydrolase [Mangrovibacterium sp.]
MRSFNRIYILALAVALSGCTEEKKEDLSQFVDPFIGTDYVGHTHPAAQLPFGMVQVGPDTGTDKWEHCSGYCDADSSIIGFSHTHLSGTGCPDMGDIMLMPVTGEVVFNRGDESNTKSGYRSSFSHESEEASPGYYKVVLDDYGIKAELTASSRVGFHKYTYPASDRSGIVIDLGHGIGDEPMETSIHFLNDSVVVGQRRSTGFAPNHNYWFYAIFSKPVKQFRSWADGKEAGERDIRGKITKMAFQFSTEKDEEILVKVALSTVSPEGAAKNLQAEIPDWDFAKVRQNAINQWNEYLRKIEVTPVDRDQKISLYTSLYHTLVMPNVISDVDGSYRLPDRTLVNENRDVYINFSLWDTYRATHSFYNIFCPEMNALFVKSMLTIFRQRGVLCTNDYGQNETWCMIGNHSVPVITDAFLKGIVQDDLALAARAVYSSLTKSHEKSNWEVYDQYGYYPFDLIPVESVSRTLEHAYDDYCASLLFGLAGDPEKQAFFRKRSDNFKNLFDSQNGLMRAKDSKGNWRTPFDKLVLSHASTSGGDYTEGNAWQYTWHVQHDIPALVSMMGGKDIFEAKLDSLFTMEVEARSAGGFHGDVTGMIGQYAHGNEPSHHVAYLYNYTGHACKTQKIIRDVFDRFYLPGRDGLSGNDDCGQMSAWYLFSAMGFYPVDPVSGQYQIGAPQVHQMKLHLSNGKVFKMEARNLSAANKYIRSVKLNGKPLDTFSISYDEIKNGGELVFEMTNQVKE